MEFHTGAFPTGFVWGAGAAAYQIEGAAREDERGPSVWDGFTPHDAAPRDNAPRDNTPRDHANVACDHYHRWREDVALMKTLGLGAYRLSIAWPRVMPQGTGAVNEAGLSFYDRLIDGLLAADIAPWVTLFHWDYPYELFCRGGWLNPDGPHWFADYVQVIVDRLSDRVTHWMPLNEPQCFLGLGHWTGTHAPGLKLSRRDALLATHHALLAHGRAVQVIRARATAKALVGCAPCGFTRYPASEAATDVEAARAAMFAVTGQWNSNSWYSDPIILGRYPEDGLRVFGSDAPKASARDMETMRQPLDFYGVNIYNGSPAAAAGPNGESIEPPRPPGHPLTAYKWTVDPQSLYWGPRFLFDRYQLPIVITENGMSNPDWIALDGQCHDPQRIDFTRRHLMALLRAIRDGVDVRGYFHWSILDNFEWNLGYRERFGLVHVDFETLERTPKDSFPWYAQLIRTNGQEIAQFLAAEAAAAPPHRVDATVHARAWRQTPATH
jgi:beta-glucosidase